MRVAHFDCFSGASGDMVLGAVLDAGVPLEAIRQALDSLELPIELIVERVHRHGIAATQAVVRAPDQKSHRHLPEIERIISRGKLTTSQRELALRIFRKLAEAEAAVHGIPVEQVHFHEVGALDSIADIVGAALGLDLLGVEAFTCSSVPTGSGVVPCAHGLMPVPAPATAVLLRGVPLAASGVQAELTTPTGAAILTTVASQFTNSPAMTIERVGHGAGARVLAEQPNILRLFVGTATADPCGDTVTMLETNLDDCMGEVIGYTIERLFAAGALDVFCIPIQMKKHRPGVLLTALCTAERAAACERIMFEETGTFGIRKSQVQRAVLQREIIEVETPWGKVKAKRGWRDGIEVFSPEYEDCARLARDAGVPLQVIYQAVRASRPATAGPAG